MLKNFTRKSRFSSVSSTFLDVVPFPKNFMRPPSIISQASLGR